jgi:hypothetical protein
VTPGFKHKVGLLPIDCLGLLPVDCLGLLPIAFILWRCPSTLPWRAGDAVLCSALEPVHRCRAATSAAAPHSAPHGSNLAEHRCRCLRSCGAKRDAFQGTSISRHSAFLRPLTAAAHSENSESLQCTIHPGGSAPRACCRGG